MGESAEVLRFHLDDDLRFPLGEDLGDDLRFHLGQSQL